MFQGTFAIITPALIVGAYVERIKFSAVVLFSSLWLVLVYAPVCHWIWGGGFLAERGVVDFAGGLVVHATCGIAALIVGLRLGKRTGFPDSPVLLPNSPMLTMMGAALLWVGWFGFNGGSALAADGAAGMAILVTHLAAAVGAITWVSLEYFEHRKTGLVTAATGMVAGLATVTPAAGSIGPVGGMLLGLAGGLACYYAVPLIRLRWEIDDSLDVFAVHGVGGMLGILLLPLLALEVFGGGGLGGTTFAGQLGAQALGVVAVVVWTAGVSYGLVRLVDATTGLRVSDYAEDEGLDIALHKERAHNWK